MYFSTKKHIDFFSVKYAGELYVQGTYDKHPGFDASATCEWHAMRDGLMAGRKQDSVRLRRPSRSWSPPWAAATSPTQVKRESETTNQANNPCGLRALPSPRGTDE